MRLYAPELLSRLNSSYWFVPLLVTLGGVGLAFALMFLDGRVALDPDGPLTVLWPSSSEGARSLLSAIIGAMITALSVTFSVTIVALTVAAQHFGPRVLNSFVRQTSAQLVLGTFMATFIYAVLVLGAIRGSGESAEVPELAVSGAVVLVIISVGALIYYVHHVSTTLQIGELASAIVLDFRQALAREEDHDAPDERQDAGNPVPARRPDAPADAARVPAVQSGYVQRVDYASIVKAAFAQEAVVWIRREPGAFVVAGTPLALVHPHRACTDTLAAVIRDAVIVGTDRTLWHDPEFAVKQLVEIALRALSPGVNEPFTALTCIDRLTEGLAAAAAAPKASGAWADERGEPRVFSQTQPFATLLHAAFDPIRIFAGPNPAIHARLLDSLAELALVVGRDERLVLEQMVEAVRAAAERAVPDAGDRAYVAARHEACLRQLQGEAASARR